MLPRSLPLRYIKDNTNASYTAAWAIQDGVTIKPLDPPSASTPTLLNETAAKAFALYQQAQATGQYNLTFAALAGLTKLLPPYIEPSRVYAAFKALGLDLSFTQSKSPSPYLSKVFAVAEDLAKAVIISDKQDPSQKVRGRSPH